MKKTTTTPKLSSEELNNCFAGLEEALMADTIQLKAIDEDIKALTLKLKKLSFEATGVTYLTSVSGAGKMGYDYDKKVIIFLQAGKPTPVPLTATSVAVRKDAHSSMLGELLMHLKRQFEAKTKPASDHLTTIATSQPAKSGLFGSKSA